MASRGMTNQIKLLRTLRPRCHRNTGNVISPGIISPTIKCPRPSIRLSSSFSSRASTLASTVSRPSALPRPSNSFASNRRALSTTPTVQFHPSPAKMGASEHVVAIKSAAEFKEKVLDSQDAIVLDCYAEWCGPCKAIAPKVEEFAKENTTVKFYQIDVDELSDVAAELGVRAMPSFFFFKGGQKVNEVVGANPPALQAGVKALLE
ncbi:thioredoxin-like protein [Aspergillus aurantiobrunneus]